VACAASGALQHQAARRKITIALVLIHTPGRSWQRDYKARLNGRIKAQTVEVAVPDISIRAIAR
jgi:hypothetical protein